MFIIIYSKCLLSFSYVDQIMTGCPFLSIFFFTYYLYPYLFIYLPSCLGHAFIPADAEIIQPSHASNKSQRNKKGDLIELKVIYFLSLYLSIYICMYLYVLSISLFYLSYPPMYRKYIPGSPKKSLCLNCIFFAIFSFSLPIYR